MIEVVYKDEKQHAKGNEGIFQLPRNVRQIGTTDQNYRVYMEDYVYTFLGRAAASGENKEEKERHLAGFMGETKWDAGTCYLFIRGAVLVSGGEISQEHIEFTDAMWQQIHEDAEKYFEGEEIVGWFLGGRMQQMEVTEMILRIHLKHFGGEKVLMLMDPVENEEAFFHYENSFMVKQSGFYIYYEKNLQMQSYMIEKNPELSVPQEEEVHDDAVRAFRLIIQKKHSDHPKENGGRTSMFSYAATACLALVVLTVGVQFYQNYSNGNKMPQEVTETASAVIKEKTKNVKKSREDVLKLDHYECQRCKDVKHKYRKAKIVHHVKHLRSRPDLALSIWDEETGERQLISVCKQCHEELHPESQRQFKNIRAPITEERWD